MLVTVLTCMAGLAWGFESTNVFSVQGLEGETLLYLQLKSALCVFFFTFWTGHAYSSINGRCAF